MENKTISGRTESTDWTVPLVVLTKIIRAFSYSIARRSIDRNKKSKRRQYFKLKVAKYERKAAVKNIVFS